MRKVRFFLRGFGIVSGIRRKGIFGLMGRGLRGWKIRGYGAVFLGILVLKKYQ
jgi:hypothetical protein